MKIISIHQPTYLPWLGFFKKISVSDIFVFLDDVQYEKNGFQNRNKIRTDEGENWLTVPITGKFGTLLKDMQIDNSSNWSKKHSKSIVQNYTNAKYFYEYWNEFESIYERKFEILVDLNVEIIRLIMKKLKINTEIVFSSQLKINEKGSSKILKICNMLQANQYISGIQGKDYLNMNEFNNSNIKVMFQNFHHPTYNQVFEPFHQNMSAIDLLFNEGEKAEKILKKAENF